MKTVKKISSASGETITEALVAVLILLMGFMIVAGAAEASARVNESIKNDEISFSILYKDTDELEIESSQETTVTISMNDGTETTETTQEITLNKTKNGYYFYDVKEPTSD